MQKHEKEIKNLYKAIETLRTSKEIENFMNDLCTPQEIKAFAERWAIAQILDEGEKSYREIAEITKASTTTVARVARFLSHERNYGYKIALERISKKN